MGENSQPDRRSDSYRLGLVIEGGGMRGVVSGGMVTGLEQLGVRPVFDVVFGSSAGALAGAYFLAGQAAVGTSIYYEDLIDGRFISFKRLIMRRGNLVNLSFLIDEVMLEQKPLDWNELFGSGIPLRPVVTSVQDFRSCALGPFQEMDALRDALRASAQIPWAAGLPVDIDGISYLDGSLAEAIPFRKALDDGCSHLLVLQTRPAIALRKRMPPAQRILLSRKYEAIAPGLAQVHVDKPARYAAGVEFLERAASGVDTALDVLVIQPSAEHRVKQLEQDRERLVSAAMSGAAAVAEGLTGRTPSYFQTFLPL